ncbi:hypothetical protein L7F22_013584 [Adiantum nelumboides]|nr:hypothetical protein [Adiantum nelumboides]
MAALAASTHLCPPFPSPSLKCTRGRTLFSPVFATLTFEGRPASPRDPILQSTSIAIPSKPDQVSHNADTQILHSIQTSPLPAILPPSQLSLPELLRHDFDKAQSFPEAVCNAADTLITQLLSPPELLPSVDPRVQLVGNCAPVGETPPTACSVSGELPSDLNGAYLRNGPNATHLHRGEGYHIFDGNGMIHSVKIEDGKATYCARYVKTARFRQEEAAGRPLFPKFFGGLSGITGAARTALVAVRTVFGLVDVTKGWGLSNTSVGFFNGKVLSLSEDDMPYVIKVTQSGDLVTLGHFTLPGTSNMCAHPKFDASTGEMFAFSFTPPSLPPFSFFRVSADGVKSRAVPVPLLDVPLVHDFAITRRYVVFPDNQLVIRPLESVRGESALVADGKKTPRFCLLPRYALPDEAAQKAQWFEAPGCNCLHYVNAWEEGDVVVLVTPVLSPPECILEVPAVNLACTLSEIRFNTMSGTTQVRKLCVGNFEFGTMNQKHVGRRCRYVYLAQGYYPELTGVVKVDMCASGGEAVVARREYGEGCTGGEPFFVPRKLKRGGEQLEEDDGYLLCYVHNEGTGLSELLVMDARSPSLKVVAAVQLPSRVPNGFHGWFVSQEQLAQHS